MKIIKGGLTAPKGFLASAVGCGIKRSGRDDLALLFSEEPTKCAGAFTVNRFRSSSVVLTEARIKRGSTIQALIVNSGNANCCVGKKGTLDAKRITSLVAERLNLKKEMVLMASTGIIGVPLPVGKINGKLGLLVKDLNKANGEKFSKAIMTTDTVHKEIAVNLKVGNKWITIGGAAKGSGMICPNMATMLAFFTTDASIDNIALRAAFKECVSRSFNRITVDGDMSTNDTAIIFANGLSENKSIKKDRPDYFRFLNALKFISRALAKKIVLDGEGATRFVTILVRGAKDEKIADIIARHVADSNLIKTMIAGGDPNWGRVAASIGSSGVNINTDSVDIYFEKILVMKNGVGAKVSKRRLSGIFKKKEIEITIDLKSGNKAAGIWTCDLTEDYVKINSEYET